MTAAPSPVPRRVLVLGATGTIGRATVRALLSRGHEVLCLVRARGGVAGRLDVADCQRLLAGATLRVVDVTDSDALWRQGFRDSGCEALVSCLASRSGVPADAWAIDHGVNVAAFAAATRAGFAHIVLLSAICVQKPRLAFQHAKLAAEQALMESGIDYSIVRPTALFKSLSGQVARVQRGKPFLLFGDGALTACKPISDRDLGDYIAQCLDGPDRRRRVLPVGGPGPAITPLEQGRALFALLGRKPRFRHVPPALLDGIVGVLGAAGRVLPSLAAKAELARIGRYYASESMLVFDHDHGRYDADATPETGTDTLFDHYARLLRGEALTELGDHAVF